MLITARNQRPGHISEPASTIIESRPSMGFDQPRICIHTSDGPRCKRVHYYFLAGNRFTGLVSNVGIYPPPFWITTAGSFVNSWQIVSIWCPLSFEQGRDKKINKKSAEHSYLSGREARKEREREAVPIFPLLSSRDYSQIPRCS